MPGVCCVKLVLRVAVRSAGMCCSVGASLLHVLACVPEERPGGSTTAPSAAIEWVPMRSYRSVPREVPSAAQMSAPAPSATLASAAASDALLQQPFSDDFERDDLGEDYLATSSAWKLEQGRLCAKGARNRPVWLRRRLPANARIEFEAVSYSEDGDIKVELFGDGSSFATTTSYTDASGYILIFGGWKNTLHVLARRDEHGKDRVALALDGLTPRSQPVVPNQRYEFTIERKDGKTVELRVNAEKILSLQDEQPLRGRGHDHFAFSAWLAPVCFDDLRVVPLGG